MTEDAHGACLQPSFRRVPTSFTAAALDLSRRQNPLAAGEAAWQLLNASRRGHLKCQPGCVAARMCDGTLHKVLLSRPGQLCECCFAPP